MFGAFRNDFQISVVLLSHVHGAFIPSWRIDINRMWRVSVVEIKIEPTNFLQKSGHASVSSVLIRIQEQEIAQNGHINNYIAAQS